MLRFPPNETEKAKGNLRYIKTTLGGQHLHPFEVGAARCDDEYGSNALFCVTLCVAKQRNFLFREECVALATDDEGNEKVQSCSPHQSYAKQCIRSQHQQLGITSQADNIDISWTDWKPDDVWKYPNNATNPMLDRPMSLLRMGGAQPSKIDEMWEQILKEILAVYPEDVQRLFFNPPDAQRAYFDALKDVLEGIARVISMFTSAAANINSEAVQLGIIRNSNLPQALLQGSLLIISEALNDAHEILTKGIGRNDPSYDNVMNILQQTGNHINNLAALLADENASPSQFTTLSEQITATLNQANVLLNDTPLQFLKDSLSILETITGMAELSLSPHLAIALHAATTGGIE